MIEVGEYVRTIDGYIFKVRKIERDENIYMISYHDDMNNYYTAENYEKINHSKNIIDLIEVGDYVNGKEVEEICSYDEDGNDKYELGIGEIDCEDVYYIPLKDIEIKSIVTKEQFEAMKYKVEE